MKNKETWNVKLPELPEDMEWEIKVFPGVTRVSIYSNRQVPRGRHEILTDTLESDCYEERETYLTNVWFAISRLAHQVHDAQERKGWLRETWGIQND